VWHAQAVATPQQQAAIAGLIAAALGGSQELLDFGRTQGLAIAQHSSFYVDGSGKT
jgi:hypothetical protein